MNKVELLKRFKSFIWRFLGMALAALLAFLAANLELFNLPAAAVAIIGLLIGEATKIINKSFELEGKILGAVKRVFSKKEIYD